MGLFSSIGGLVNDLTGASNSANSSYKYNAALQNQNWAHQKEAMQNAVQWRAKDLEAAGFNPALAAGEPASTGGAGGGGGGVNAPMGDLGGLLNVLTSFGNLANSTKMTNAQTGLLDAQTTAQITNNKYISEKTKSAILNTMADTSLKKAMTRNSAADTALKGQLKATSAADEKVKKEQKWLTKQQIETERAKKGLTHEQANHEIYKNYETQERTKQIKSGWIGKNIGTDPSEWFKNIIEELIQLRK